MNVVAGRVDMGAKFNDIISALCRTICLKHKNVAQRISLLPKKRQINLIFVLIFVLIFIILILVIAIVFVSALLEIFRFLYTPRSITSSPPPH